MPQISLEQAAQFLAEGAVVLDVRTPGEFAQEHLAGVQNVPMAVLAEQVPKKFPDREQVLLLHCLSGGRSSQGVTVLRRLGYKNVHNLGSFMRARSILSLPEKADPSGSEGS